MKKKLLYESPDVEVIELKLENNQMQNASPDGTWDNSIKSGSTWGGSDDDSYGLE